MISIRLISILLLIIGFTDLGFGQVPAITAHNSKLLDSVRRDIEVTFCGNEFRYLDRYKKKELKKAVSILKLVDYFFENQVTIAQADSIISTINHKKVRTWRRSNGALEILDIDRWERYLSVTLNLVYLEGRLITRKVQLRPFTPVWCPLTGSGLPDLKIFADHFLTYIQYPIRIMDHRVLFFAKFDPDNFGKVAANHAAYKRFSDYFSDSTKDWVYYHLVSQFDPDSSADYSKKYVEPGLRRLIKEQKYHVIRDLVFSPNYVAAINAMEGMLYLAHLGKVTLDDELQQKIKELMESDYKINVRSDDTIWPIDGYKSAKITDQAIYQKFEHPPASRIW